MLESWISSKKLNKILYLGWIVTLIYAYFGIPPRVDDGYYLIPALSVVNGYPPGLFIAEEFRPIFFISPVQPFLNGLFLSLISLLGLSPDIYNYRLFNMLLVLLLLICVLKTYRKASIEDPSLYSSQNIFLILIAFTPFASNFYVNRPEILGLLTLICGFLWSYKIMQQSSLNYYSLAVGSFFLGLASIIHPNYALYAIPILSFTAYSAYTKHKQFIPPFFYLLFSSLPAVFLILWFFYNYTTAYEQLFTRAGEVVPEFSLSMPSGIVNIVKNSFLLIGDSLIHKIYNSIFMTPFLASLLICFYFLVRQKKVNFLNSFLKGLLLILISVSFILLIIMVPYPPYYLTISFVIVFAVSIFLSKQINYLQEILKDSKFLKFISIIFVCLLALSPLVPSLSHFLKVQSTEGEYYDLKRINSLTRTIDENDTLIITTGQLLPPFVEKINLQLSQAKSDSVYWLFPIADKPGEDFRVLFNKEIDIVMEINKKSKTIWGSLKKGLVYSAGNKNVCISLKGGFDYIKLISISVETEDRDNIFLRPKNYLHYSSLEECISSRT